MCVYSYTNGNISQEKSLKCNGYSIFPDRLLYDLKFLETEVNEL